MTIVALPLLAWLSFGQAPAPQAMPAPDVSGLILDVRTQAPVASARVVIRELARAVQTGADGRFAFGAVPPGRYTVTVSLIGYIFVRRTVDVEAGRPIDVTIPLTEGTGTYQETVSVNPPAASAQVGVGSQVELGSAALQELRGVAADDPMRAVQALPGVATGDDFQSQFSVRGSEFRHVGIVLDDTATPLLLHTIRSTNDTGSIAMINTDMLDRASLMAGAHPQRHGDWLGATLDFGLREGSRDRPQVRGTASATAASLVAEGPIGRAKRGAWLTSIRQSYIDWLVRKIDPSIDGTLGFWDVQTKLTYDLTSRQQIQFVAIGGDSAFRNEKTSLANGIHLADSKSALLSATWRYTRDTWLLTERVSYVGSRFGDQGLTGQQLGQGEARALVWRGDAARFFGKAWSVQGGGKSEWQRESLTLRNFTIAGGAPQQRVVTTSAPRTTLNSAWGQVERRTAGSGVSLGARVTNDTLSGQTITSPWLLAERTIGPLTFRGSAGMSHQFPELELQRSLPDRIAEHATSVDAGVEETLPHGMRWQVTAFGRREGNVLRRIGEDRIEDDKRVTESIFPEYADTLDGRSHGVDVVFARRGASDLTGWVAYTYARTREHDRSTLEDFDADFDQRHTLNVFLQERLLYRTSVSAKLRVGSNFPLVGYFQGTPEALRLGTARNQVRLPPYARLDLRATRTYTFDQRRLTLFLEVVNATNRANLGQNDGFISGSAFNAVGYTRKLIPIVPSAGILIEF